MKKRKEKKQKDKMKITMNNRLRMKEKYSEKMKGIVIRIPIMNIKSTIKKLTLTQITILDWISSCNTF